MGALAPVSSSWVPEDDLLLKNAIEAGASLESLAKGAVQFSRKFTVREIQQRWHFLLYDPVAEEAGFHMIELERSISNLPSKLGKFGNLKDSKCISAKRKVGSVRNCYYALRKRIRNEPFSSLDFSFLVAPSNGDYIGNKDEPVLGDSVSDHFGLQQSGFNIMNHGFQQIADDAIGAQFQNTVQQDYQMEQDSAHEEQRGISHILEENQSHGGNESSVKDFAQLDELSVDADQMCGSSFHNLEYPSPLPEMPIWRADEGISGPCIPIDLGLREKDMQTGNSFALPGDDDTMNACSSIYDINTESNIKLPELSNSLLDFTNEEEFFFMDGYGKEVADMSFFDGVNGLLMSSPNDNQDDIPGVTEPVVLEAPNLLTDQFGACPGELDQDRKSHCGGNVVPAVQFFPSVSASNPEFPEMMDGVICCLLNTEDPEIPCNDDIVFTNHARQKLGSSSARRNFQVASKPNLFSVKEVVCNQKPYVGPALVKRDPENPGESNIAPQMIGSQARAEVRVIHPISDNGAKFELPSSESTHRTTTKVCSSSNQINAVTVGMEAHLPPRMKEEIIETMCVRQFSQNTSSSLRCDPPTISISTKEQLDAPSRLPNHQDVSEAEQVVNHPITDPEEPPIESDDDVPYFSDVEAMILDMDLAPNDQDLHSYEEVSRYQHEDATRAIMRLEQSAHSYMQRAIASHGAFAVLYGRRSKHFIKKAEVLLGRATEDIIVDIDLGREGPANRISRRQAIIYLDKNGSFHLKNLGKTSISVNDKEIAPGQILVLTHNCLIEIRGMTFVFEMNQTCIKRYLDNTT